MDDKDFNKEMVQAVMDGINNMFDAMAENVANKMAQDIIQMVEEELTCEPAKGRKELIYLKIAEALQNHVEKMSGEVKVE